MKKHTLKIQPDKWNPANDAEELRLVATEMHDELMGKRPPHRNHIPRLKFVLRTLKAAEVLEDREPGARRLTWRERITGRAQA